MSVRSNLTISSRCLTVAILLSCSIANPSIAQTPLPPPQDVQPPAEKPLPAPQVPPELPDPSEILKPSLPNSTPEQQLPNVPQTFIIKGFEVLGSTVFSQERLAKELECSHKNLTKRLQEKTKCFTNRPITFAELLEARSAITNLYIKEGYLTSGAYIPEQELDSNGIVKIQVVEGRLEDIQITGTRRLQPGYIRSRIAVATQPPLNQKKLIQSLELLKLNPLIQNISAELAVGTRPGTNILALKINEANSFAMQTVLDNGRSPSVGSFRRRVQLNEGNLLGFGDGLSLSYSNTDGSNSIDTSYSVPLNPYNGTLTFSYGTSSSNIIEKPFNILDIESSSRYYELTFRQPVYQTSGQELALGLTASRRESEASYNPGQQGRINFPSVGADDDGSTRVSALRFFQEWTSRNSQEVLAARSQLSLGIGAFDATINKEGPDSRFFAWQLSGQWVRRFAPDTLLFVRTDMQLASTPLLPLEQFSLGGIDSVRGYRQNFLLTDNAAFASAELRVPIMRISKNGVLQIAPFVDVGVGWNNSNDTRTPETNTLASVGLGLRWSQGNNFTASLDWGIPLISADNQGDTLQENGLYFSLQYNPF